MKYERILALLKCLLGAYVITGLLLLLTAGLLYKCNLSEKVIDCDYCNLCHFLTPGGIILFQGSKKQKIPVGNGSRCGIFPYYMCIVDCHGAGF